MSPSEPETTKRPLRAPRTRRMRASANRSHSPAGVWPRQRTMRRNISRRIVLMTFNALLGLLSIRLYADLTLGFCQICCLLHNLTHRQTAAHIRDGRLAVRRCIPHGLSGQAPATLNEITGFVAMPRIKFQVGNLASALACARLPIQYHNISGGLRVRIFRPVNMADVMLPPSCTSVTTTAIRWRTMTTAST